MKLNILLYKFKILRLTNRKVKSWHNSQNIDNLIFALENGIYDVRALAANYLGDSFDPKAIPALRNGIDDKVKMVSMACIDSLRKITHSPEIDVEINAKMEEWIIKEKNLKTEGYQGSSDVPKWKKRDWIAIVRHQLKNPMRWG